MRFNEVVLFVQIVHRGPEVCAGAPSLSAPVMTTYCSDVRQQSLLEDDIAVV